jgi:dienelactone hydrolase
VTHVTDFSTRTLRLPSAPVHGTLFVPAAAEPAAAVLLIGGSGGSEPTYVGEALAGQGIAALSVAYFARPGLPGQLRGIPLEYFFAALQILHGELPSPSTPLAVLGMSRGSEAAMLTAIHSPIRVCGVAATVPGNVVAGSWPPGGPAWLLGGRPLPYVDHFRPGVRGSRCPHPCRAGSRANPPDGRRGRPGVAISRHGTGAVEAAA